MLSHLLNNNHTILLFGSDHLIPGGGYGFVKKSLFSKKWKIYS